MAEISSGVCKWSVRNSNLHNRTYKVFGFTLRVDLDMRSSGFLDNFEWPVLHVLFDLRVIDFATNKSLCVEYGVFRIGGKRVLRRVTNSRDRQHKIRKKFVVDLQSLFVRETNPRGCNSVTLVVCEDFYSATALYTVKRVRKRVTSHIEK